MESKKPSPDERVEHILDGCTRVKLAVIALKRMGVHVLGVTVPGKNPKIMIEPPAHPIPELNGESVSQWSGAGGRRMVTYIAFFQFCRVEWTKAREA